MNYVVIDLGFGDSGKGVTVARLTEPGDTIIKFSGGAQAAHNVVWEGKHHTFSQFGSGMMRPHVSTFLTKNFLVDVPAIFKENNHLMQMGVHNALSRLYIAHEAVVITEPMVLANRQVEKARGNGRHGSTGRGIGMTAAFDAETHMGLLMKDLSNIHVMKMKLEVQQHWIYNKYGVVVTNDQISEEVERLFGYHYRLQTVNEYEAMRFFNDSSNKLIFEGSQGILLDENIGFFPHVTRSTVTSCNAFDAIAPLMKPKYVRYDGGIWEDVNETERPTVLGVVRTYMTRHGAGPLPTEFHDKIDDGDHNGHGEFQGAFRRGYFDLSLVEYSLKHQPVDQLVVTHSDIQLQAARSLNNYEQSGSLVNRAYQTSQIKNKYELFDWPATPANISDILGIPLHSRGWGPDVLDSTVHMW